MTRKLASHGTEGSFALVGLGVVLGVDQAVAPATIEVGMGGGAARGGLDKSYLLVRSYLFEEGEDRSYLCAAKSYLWEVRLFSLSTIPFLHSV